jgi:putative AdoMet-dependent methyltransferase
VLSNQDFDKWAGEYDEHILAMQNKGYPFEGYYKTLGYIQNKIKSSKAARILDIGIGTGLLTETLYREGIEITGVDFSARMLELAKIKMPDARFIQFDFNQGLPTEIKGEKFDFVISSYALHHIDDDQKIDFLTGLMHNLNPGGFVLIGDIAFETTASMVKVREQSTGWDEAEHYLVAETILDQLAEHQIEAEFVKTSNCSGVLVIQAP